jgi:uncharacterized membrane protein
LGFEKREIVLIVGVLFLMIGMLAMFPMYGWETIVLAIAIYFGMRVFVGRRKKQMQKAIGEGVCAVCGEQIVNKKCPKCDIPNKP